jgi:glycosyltransferase involved in cell wall biosynthesis
LIAAAKLLQDRGRLTDAVVVLAGDAQGRDGYRRQLESEIQAAGLLAHVRMPGHVDQMTAAYRLAHVAVIASVEPEAFGRTSAEAQVMGCPVIATNLGAPPETVRALPHVSVEDRTGWLVSPGDASELADALSEALDLAPQARAIMGVAARAHVLACFTLDAMRQQTLDVYDALLKSGLKEHYRRGMSEKTS